MGHRHGCGPRGRIEFNVPEALFAIRGGRGGSWGPFRFDFDEFDGDWGSGGRRRRNLMFKRELRLVLLKLIADQPRHGYDLIRAVEEMTGGEYAPSPGLVYPTLTLLQDIGFIQEVEAEGQRKVYAATGAGREHLAEKANELEELFDRLADLAPDRDRTAGPAIGRAVKNLMTALSHRISRDGVDEDLLHEIAAILDEAAQRIERVK